MKSVLDILRENRLQFLKKAEIKMIGTLDFLEGRFGVPSLQTAADAAWRGDVILTAADHQIETRQGETVIKVHEGDWRRNHSHGTNFSCFRIDVRINPGAKRVPGQIDMLVPVIPETTYGCQNVFLFTNAVTVTSLARSHSPEIETQGSDPLVLIHVRNGLHHRIVHVAAKLRVRVSDNNPLRSLPVADESLDAQVIRLKLYFFFHGIKNTQSFICLNNLYVNCVMQTLIRTEKCF